MYFVVLVTLEVKPFPSPVDLNVAFRIKGTDAGCRALEVTSVDGGSELIFVAELDVVHSETRLTFTFNVVYALKSLL